MRDGFLPAAVGCDQPLEIIERSRRLTVTTERQEWPPGVPRRAGVSAFGFGGTNAHLIIEAWEGQTPRARRVQASPRLAVIGLAHHVGVISAPPTSVSRGIDGLPIGKYCDSVDVDPRRFRVPPVELADMLPQHLLMLEMAADALDDAGTLDGQTTAAIIGMGLDHHICEPVIRWATGSEAVSPALTTSRVLGCLPNFVANRISAQLDLRGPSYTTSSGELSGVSAIDHAGRLLASGEADTVVVGAVDFPGHLGASSAGAVRQATPVEGAAALVLKRLEDVDPKDVYAIIEPIRWTSTDTIPASGAEAVQALIALLPVLGAGGVAVVDAPFARAEIQVERGERAFDKPTDPWNRVLSVPHSGPEIPAGSRWVGPYIPLPLATPRGPNLQLSSGQQLTSLEWSIVSAPVGPFTIEIAALGQLAASMGSATTAMVDAHQRFLEAQIAAQDDLSRMADLLEQATVALSSGTRMHRPAPVDDSPPRTYDRRALERHAAGKISEVFGPTFADLDPFEPRVRMPMAPLLLCDRVVEIEGERGGYGPARIVTEYDVP